MSDHEAVLTRLSRRMRAVIGRGRISMVDDSGPVQTVQASLSAFELFDGIPRVVEFGLASCPPAASEAVFVFIAGDRSNGIVIGTNHQASRMRNLAPGEAALYDVLGRSIYLKADGGIVVEAANDAVTVNNATTVTINASTEVVLNTPTLTVNGDIKATGKITDAVRSMADDRSIYDGHTHGGVSAGSGNTDPPNQTE